MRSPYPDAAIAGPAIVVIATVLVLVIGFGVLLTDTEIDTPDPTGATGQVELAEHVDEDTGTVTWIRARLLDPTLAPAHRANVTSETQPSDGRSYARLCDTPAWTGNRCVDAFTGDETWRHLDHVYIPCSDASPHRVTIWVNQTAVAQRELDCGGRP